MAEPPQFRCIFLLVCILDADPCFTDGKVHGLRACMLHIHVCFGQYINYQLSWFVVRKQTHFKSVVEVFFPDIHFNLELHFASYVSTHMIST